MKKPKFLYFDLGKVLLNFDHELAVHQLAKTLAATPDTVRSLLFEGPLQADYERGHVSTQQFCDVLRKETSSKVSDAAICLAASEIFHVNCEIMPLITGLVSTGVPMGILSNTCDAHWDYIVNRPYSLVDLFPIHVLSFQVGSSKPDGSIYQHAAKITGCRPDELFFVDDRADNVAGAINAGLDAIVFESTAQLRRDLRNRGIRFNS